MIASALSAFFSYSARAAARFFSSVARASADGGIGIKGLPSSDVACCSTCACGDAGVNASAATITRASSIERLLTKYRVNAVRRAALAVPRQQQRNATDDQSAGETPPQTEG